MSQDEIERGKEAFRKIVGQRAPAVLLNIGAPTQGRYRVMFIGRKSTMRFVDEQEFEDLANNGGVHADITMKIDEALREIGELGRP